MSYKERAISYFKQGFNCAQSIVMAFCDLIGWDQATSAKVASSFGGGFGRLREVCGAVSGMGIVLGALCGYDDPKIPGAAGAHYARVQKVAEEFKKENGSIVCRELLGGVAAVGGAPEERTAEFYKKRPCQELVGSAAEILENYLKDIQPLLFK